MRWTNLVFIHWRADPERLRRRLPPGLVLDLFHGSAFVTLVGLQATGPLLQPMLATPLAPLVSYQQLNLRTYVIGDSGPGVSLLDTRVDRTFPLAARLVGLPYHLDGELDLHEHDGAFRLRARDLAIDVALLADMPESAVDPHGLGDFVLNRFRTYAKLPGGLSYAVEMTHAPWQVRPMVVLGDPPPAPLGLSDAGPVSVNSAAPVEVCFTHVERPAVTA
jgi:uncharacterized protein YqjF (DUF2071 family)